MGKIFKLWATKLDHVHILQFDLACPNVDNTGILLKIAKLYLCNIMVPNVL